MRTTASPATSGGYAEGECYFPGSPLLVVEATFADAVVLETLVLSILNHDSAIAAAASRMTYAAGDRPCIEMGSRRTHEISGGGRRSRGVHRRLRHHEQPARPAGGYGIPTAGTAAHAFTLLHDSEREAFEAQIASLGSGHDAARRHLRRRRGGRTAIEVAGAGAGRGSARLGRPPHPGAATYAPSSTRLGATKTRIVVTSAISTSTRSRRSQPHRSTPTASARPW